MAFKLNKIIGQSPKLQEVLRTADLVAGTAVPVLISGETGTGKDIFAQRIHQQSPRKQRPFIKLSCNRLMDNNAEEMLFGRKGYLAQAHTGSLFLDEVSELSSSLQSQLLHFIETSEVLVSSTSKPQKYDARMIVASSKDLQNKVDEGNFRKDLFYRLNVIPVSLPALRERTGDVALLGDFFFRKLVHEQHQIAPSVSKAAQKYLDAYDWPGNVRELHNFCERMYLLFSGKQIEVTNLPQEIRLKIQSPKSIRQPFSLPATGIILDEVEVDLIQQALLKTDGNKSQAARLLGLTRDTFLYRLKKYAIAI